MQLGQQPDAVGSKTPCAAALFVLQGVNCCGVPFGVNYSSERRMGVLESTTPQGGAASWRRTPFLLAHGERLDVSDSDRKIGWSSKHARREEWNPDMNRSHRLAQLLVASWRLSEGTSRIPTSHGILDRALKAVVRDGELPQWASEALNFIDSRVGLQCAELPEVLDWAQRSQLTTAPNPSYETTEVQISERVARHLLGGLQVSVEEAERLGKALRSNVLKAADTMAEFEHARIEDY